MRVCVLSQRLAWEGSYKVIEAKGQRKGRGQVKEEGRNTGHVDVCSLLVGGRWPEDKQRSEKHAKGTSGGKGQASQGQGGCGRWRLRLNGNEGLGHHGERSWKLWQQLVY